MNYLRMTSLLASALLLSTLSLSAFAAGSIELKSIAEVEKNTTNKDGKKETKRIIAKKVPPDGIVIYTTSFKNVGNKPAGNIVINNPIAEHTEYVADSAIGDNTDITFSADAGKNFASPEKLTVTSADGKVRPALASDYTHIKWTYKGELAEGKTSEVSFKAKVK